MEGNGGRRLRKLFDPWKLPEASRAKPGYHLSSQHPGGMARTPGNNRKGNCSWDWRMMPWPLPCGLGKEPALMHSSGKVDSQLADKSEISSTASCSKFPQLSASSYSSCGPMSIHHRRWQSKGPRQGVGGSGMYGFILWLQVKPLYFLQSQSHRGEFNSRYNSPVCTHTHTHTLCYTQASAQTTSTQTSTPSTYTHMWPSIHK